MKLYYYRRRDNLPNFGDELNAQLWAHLLPGVFDGDETEIFVGFGTLLNSLLPERVKTAKRVIFFSTGAGYEKPLKAIAPHWEIHCLRGPLSARMLGLPPEMAVTDGAMLVRHLFEPDPEKRHPFAFMPHVHHAKFAKPAWQEICDRLGWRYIDPTDPVEAVISAISETEVLLAEAMHGAIVADALRVRWIPVVTSPRILEFKWRDWCASVGCPYHPRYLPPLSPYPRYGRGVRSGLAASRHWGKHRLQFPVSDSVAENLRQIAENTPPQLSSDARLEGLISELETRLEGLKRHLL